jgi:hypothetical protein
LAVIGDTDCDVDEFFRESIECSKGHGGLQTPPKCVSEVRGRGRWPSRNY